MKATVHFLLGSIAGRLLLSMALIIGGTWFVIWATLRGFEGPAHLVMGSMILIILIWGALAPTLIAYRRGHHDRLAIMTLNILFGWTGLGWIIALIWSLTHVQRV
jgi:hypothetical protein